MHIKNRWKVWCHMASRGWKGLKVYINDERPPSDELCSHQNRVYSVPAKYRKWRLSNWHSFKYNQQDATLYNILYYCQCSTCFRRFLRPSSGAQKLYTQHRVCARFCLLLPLAVAASKPGTYPMLCVQFLSSWWWAEKPPGTCRALTVIKNIV